MEQLGDKFGERKEKGGNREKKNETERREMKERERKKVEIIPRFHRTRTSQPGRKWNNVIPFRLSSLLFLREERVTNEQNGKTATREYAIPSVIAP